MAKERVDYVTPEARLAYLNLFEPKHFMRNGKPMGEAKFSLMMLFPKGDVDDLKAGALKAARAEWPGVKASDVRWPFKDGDKEADRLIAKGKTEAQVEFMRGLILVKAASKYAPEVVDANRKPIVSKDAVYSGVYGHVAGVFNAYEQDDGEKGVGLYFDKVLISRKGDRIAGGGRSAADVFAGVSGGTSNVDPTEGLDDDEIPF